MSKNYVSKFARRVVEIEMPKTIRRAYKNGETIDVKVKRFGKNAWLASYGDEIEFTVSRNGELVKSPFDVQGQTPVEWIIDYMLTGHSGEVNITFNGVHQRSGRHEYNHSWPTKYQDSRRKAGKKFHEFVLEWEREFGRKWDM